MDSKDAGPPAFDVKLTMATGRHSPECDPRTIKVSSSVCVLQPAGGRSYMSLCSIVRFRVYTPVQEIVLSIGVSLAYMKRAPYTFIYTSAA